MTTIRLDETRDTLHLAEATGGRRRRILIISPGRGSSGNYPADVLERDGPQVIRAGTHMYLDHPGRAEERDRPERSVRDLAAVLETDAVWDPAGSDGPGLYAEARILPTMAPVVDALAEHIGVSIRGAGERDSDGTITSLLAVESVDFVTKAGRGGRVLEILESARTTEALSANEMRDAVWDAVRAAHGTDDVHAYLQDFSVDEGWVVFELWGNDQEAYYRASLTVDGDDVTLSDDEVEVERQVTWTPADDVTEALREAREQLREARNVGQWFESHIHLDFTTTADHMAADGRLTRDERIALSNSIGAALDAFRLNLEELAPHLYDRDPYDTPDTTTRTEESTMTEQEMNDRIASAEAARDAAIEERDTALTERDEARTEAENLREAQRDTRARDIVREALSHVRFDSDAVRDDVVAARATNPPLTEAGDLDEDALRTRVTEAYPAPQGRVTGLGEATTAPPPPAAADELREANGKKVSEIFSLY